MEVINKNSKRLRRPNVRLWEIGDLSAAFACSHFPRNKENLGQNQWTIDPYLFKESEYLHSTGENKSEYHVQEHGVLPKILGEMQNREIKDLDSIKLVSPATRSTNGSKLDFGTITKKSRLMRRSLNSTCSLFVGPWNSDAGLDMHNANGIKDSSENETQFMINEVCEVEIDEHDDFSIEIPKSHNEFASEAASYEDNTAFTQSTDRIDKMVMRDGSRNRVRGWLEDLGFGKFGQMFEMHEVDEDALPLLTFEDLKEMGIVAVGPRRKLFREIQRLKGGQ